MEFFKKLLRHTSNESTGQATSMENPGNSAVGTPAKLTPEQLVAKYGTSNEDDIRAMIEEGTRNGRNER